jgi:pimeloyl-ACP methyl ester carboxylesterase
MDWRVVAIDLLGFGRSDKPWPHAYRIIEQADRVERVWKDFEIESTHLVVHDHSSSIGQELLAWSDVHQLTSTSS